MKTQGVIALQSSGFWAQTGPVCIRVYTPPKWWFFGSHEPGFRSLTAGGGVRSANSIYRLVGHVWGYPYTRGTSFCLHSGLGPSLMGQIGHFWLPGARPSAWERRRRSTTYTYHLYSCGACFGLSLQLRDKFLPAQWPKNRYFWPKKGLFGLPGAQLSG